MLNLHYCGSLLGADRKRHDIAQPLFTLFLGVQQNEPVACSCRLKLRTAYQQPEYIFQYKICCEHWEKHGKICVSASHVCSRPAPKKTANSTWCDYKYKYSHLTRLLLSRVFANCVFKQLLPISTQCLHFAISGHLYHLLVYLNLWWSNAMALLQLVQNLLDEDACLFPFLPESYCYPSMALRRR